MTCRQIATGVKKDEHGACDHGAEDGRHIGGHVDDPVGAGQILLENHLGQDAVLRGAKESTLSTHQEQHREHRDDRQVRIDPLQSEGGHSERHRHHLHALGHDDDLTLGESICQRTAENSEQNERQREDRHRHRLSIDGHPVDGNLDGDQHDELSEYIVVEGAEQLSPGQRMERVVFPQRQAISFLGGEFCR